MADGAKFFKNTHTLWSMVLAGVVLLNFVLWMSVRQKEARWLNVPPPPDVQSASSSGLGDTQLSYRAIAYMLQNLGDSGGHSRPLKDYNYDMLAKWFFLTHNMDARSNSVPYMAAYYFSAVQTPKVSLPPLVRYLEYVGSQKGQGTEKWRWLAQAIYLARYKLEDLDWALDMSRKLKAMDSENGIKLPLWAKNMDAMILSVKGDKDAAYGIMLHTLETEGQNIEQAEYLFIVDHICHEILSEEEAKQNSLCEAFPNE
jgi:hypothetical protein